MTAEHHEVVIVGAGFSGIGTTIALKKAGIRDVLVVDDASGPGGVWHWNTYPGVAVDIPSFSYQFSFAQRANWSRTYAHGRELKDYADQCVARYDLAKHLRFNTRVLRATFDEAANLWRVGTSSGDFTARWLIHAGGPLSQPKLPDIAGIGTFAGQTMHTSRWDHTIDLAGKRVGIIGTGASAVQVIPEIAPHVKQLTVFQRTPIWCLPKLDYPISRTARLLLRALPGAKALSRLVSHAYVEFTFPIMAHFHGYIPGTKAIQNSARRYLASQVKDPETRQKLTPSYVLGCKRPGFHNTYLATFNRDNVALETRSIEEITPMGVRTADGTGHELDVLILATGFKVTEKDAIPSYTLTGRGGLNLAEWWDQARLQAYQGVSAPGFPNYFTTFGPYGYNGASFFTLIENSAAHIVRVLREARRQGAATAEVRSSAHQAYLAKMLGRRDHQVFWHPSCQQANSYYFTKHGDVPLRAATTLEAAWQSRHFPLTDYEYAS